MESTAAAREREYPGPRLFLGLPRGLRGGEVRAILKVIKGGFFMQKGALVLEGGSFRGMFTAGVLDVLMDGQIWFEYVNGVSAGALCGYNYIARQPGRTRDINETFCADRRFLGLNNLLRNGGVFNFNFLFGEVCSVLSPLDRAAFSASPQIFEAVATDCLTGHPEYFRKGTVSPEDFDLACRASSSMPALSEIVYIGGVPYLDGGCACPVAYRRAMELGYEKRVVVLTRPAGYRRKPRIDGSLERVTRRLYAGRYPAFFAALREMNRRYNAQYAELERMERAGEVFLLRPAEPVLVGQLERRAEKLEALYQQGRGVCMERLEDLMRYLYA